MRKLALAALAAALAGAPAFAQDKAAQDKAAAPKQMSPDQQKRTDECTQQARQRNLQGRERNTFMSACMRGETPKK